MKGFGSVGGAQRFLAAFSGTSPHFRPCRHLMTATEYCTEMTIDAAVAQVRAESHELRDEDVARPSPLRHKNLNVSGRYSFTASTPADGSLRSLRDPDAPG